MIGSLLWLILIGILALLVRSFIPAYAAEKGKNLATKEDVAAITREVEGAKAAFSKAGHAYNLQFEHEFDAYTEIWELVVGVQAAAENLRPAMDTFLESEIDRKDRDEKRFNNLSEAVRQLSLTIHKRKPFYPSEIFEKLIVLKNAAHEELTAFQHREHPGDGEQWREAVANLKTIMQAGDAVGQAIRERLTKLRVIE